MSYNYGYPGPKGSGNPHQLGTETEKALKAYYEEYWGSNLRLSWEQWRKQYPQNLPMLMQHYSQYTQGKSIYKAPEHPEVLIGDTRPKIDDDKFLAAWNAWKTAASHPEEGGGI